MVAIHRFSLWLAAFAASLVPVVALESWSRFVPTPAGGSFVEVSGVFSELPRHGYAPARITVANREDRPHTVNVSFDFQSTQYGDSSVGASTACTVDVPAGTTVVREVLVPVAAPTDRRGYRSDYLNIQVSGSMGSDGTSRENSDLNLDVPPALLSEALNEANQAEFNRFFKTSSSSRYSGNAIVATFLPEELPSDWRAYSGFDSLTLTADEWSRVPSPARQALFSWLRLGGRLVVCSPADPLPASAGLGIPADTGFGSVAMVKITPKLTIEPARWKDFIDSKNPVRSLSNSLPQDYLDKNWPLRKTLAPKSFNQEPFIFVLIVFALLVGPVNLFLFAKSGKRHRLFVTTPIISLATCLLLVVLIVLVDGFGGNGNRIVLMEVPGNPDQANAYVHQEQLSRTGILTGSRFTLQTPALIYPALMTESPWTRYHNGRNVKGNFNLTPVSASATAASGDWWLSRSEHAHCLTAVLPSRGRIEVGTTPGMLVASFDFRLDSFFFLAPDGQWHRARNITAGTPFRTEPCQRDEAMEAIDAAAQQLSRRNQLMLKEATKRPGHFFAIASRGPAVDSFDSIRWTNTTTFITGAIQP